MNDLPLVSCIMPTANRRAFVPRAIQYFLRQDYPAKELVILDDGADSVADLIPGDPRIRYWRETRRRTLGAKRNALCEEARGEFIAHWDDDDWQARFRLSYQSAALLRSGKELCGINQLLFYEPATRLAWQYRYPSGERHWLSGSTLCYRKRYWQAHPFRDIQVGEDAYFVWSGSTAETLLLAQHDFHVGIIHGSNASRKRVSGAWWKPLPSERIEQMLAAEDMTLPPAVQPEPPASTNAAVSIPTCREIPAMTIALDSDLALPEYQAFNQAGPPLPRMRRWELPFALFQARLEDTMTVLDCTINPFDFGRRLNLLYPHVSYRQWSPIQRDRFCLPFGFPDGAFDRVFCVNTLEHLLREQRDALVDALARLLKPGGRLVFTSDYYFESSWSNPAFLSAGVMRSDRAEIFNGWNRVDSKEWLDLFERQGLRPFAAWKKDPEEGDRSLFLNDAPYTHATIGGVFSNGVKRKPRDARRVVLALLTWNTRDVSLESVRAYQQESRLLQRLGHKATICVCDNGSDDGTPEALEKIGASSAVPIELILNDHNAGNSIARNQIIDFALRSDADYLLFMDGDIEVVPFSSVAMLRHMETCGSRLGCIGAETAGQTPERRKASKCWYSVTGQRIDTTDLVAFTQYGLFRCEMFRAGIRFDTSAPFDGPGWGFEDNDLAFQMKSGGYVNECFYGMVYLHRAVRSSVRIMRQKDIDVTDLFTRRQRYLISKWTGNPNIEAGHLVLLRRVTAPA